MTTPVTSNLASLLQAPAQAGRKNASPDPQDASFKQLLKREVADRRNTEGAAKNKTSEKDAASRIEQPPSAQRSPNESAGKSPASVSQQDGESPDRESEATNQAAASTDLLALVANIVQNKASVGDSDLASAELRMQIDARSTRKSMADTDQLTAMQLEKNLSAQDDSALDFTDELSSAAFSAGGLAARTSLAVDSQGASTVASTVASTAVSTAASTAVALPPLQQTANTQAAGTPATVKLTPQVGTPAWDQAVGQKMVWMAAGAQQSASLTLNPPNLGPLQIVLTVTNSQADAMFIAPHAEVRQALEAAMPKLREMLDGAGIQLGQADVSAGNPQQGNGFERRAQQASHLAGHDVQTDLLLQAPVQARMSGGLGMVDTFA